MICAVCGKNMGDGSGAMGMLVIHFKNKHFGRSQRRI